MLSYNIEAIFANRVHIKILTVNIEGECARAKEVKIKSPSWKIIIVSSPTLMTGYYFTNSSFHFYWHILIHQGMENVKVK